MVASPGTVMYSWLCVLVWHCNFYYFQQPFSWLQAMERNVFMALGYDMALLFLILSKTFLKFASLKKCIDCYLSAKHDQFYIKGKLNDSFCRN